MTLLAKTTAGSRLYGLDNANSDTDEKGIFLPSLTDCVLGRAPSTQSEKRPGYEYEAFSLQRFLQHAARAEDVAMVMLHSNKVLVDSSIYQMLRANRKRFYTRNMSGQMSFSRSMAAKYALRADRMETVEQVIHHLELMVARGVAKLGQAWDDLPNHLTYATKGENPLDRNADKRVYTVVGKGLTAGIAPSYALDIMTKVRDSYGERVKNAKQMDGQDLKAVSHSFRVAYQLKHVYLDGDYSFPLPESDFIRAIKEGSLNYVTDSLDDKLNDLITEVEQLAEASSYPDKVDAAWLDKIVLEAYER